METISLENDLWRIGLTPENGGCVAYGQINVDNSWMDVLRPTPADRLGEWWYAASYPLIPWSNRIRHGKLQWKGQTYQLRRWGTDDFAMHGTAVEFPWIVIERSADHVILEFDSRKYFGVNFPWNFVSHANFALDGPRLTVRLSIENADEDPFPAGMGHHPYFVRSIIGSKGSRPVEARLQVNCDRAYELDNCMPAGPSVPVPSTLDFRSTRGLGSVLVDDCFTGRFSSVAATIEYPEKAIIDLEADELLSHVVVYIPVGEPYFAVEPVTNANDGFTLEALGVPGSGVFSIEPGHSRTTEFSLNIR